MAADVGETGPVVAAVVVPLTAVAAAAVGPSVAVVGVAVAVVASAEDAGEAQEVMAVAEGEDLRTAGPRRPAVHTALNLAAVSVVGSKLTAISISLALSSAFLDCPDL